MADTLTNTPVVAEEYRDVYLLAGISSGTDVVIQNIGTTDLYFSISTSQPPKDNDAYRIFKRGDVVTVDQGDPSIWVFSTQADGLINVKEMVSTDLFDLLNTNFLLLTCQLAVIIRELELLNLRTEEMGNTGITKRDV